MFHPATQYRLLVYKCWILVDRQIIELSQSTLISTWIFDSSTALCHVPGTWDHSTKLVIVTTVPLSWSAALSVSPSCLCSTVRLCTLLPYVPLSNRVFSQFRPDYADSLVYVCVDSEWHFIAKFEVQPKLCPLFLVAKLGQLFHRLEESVAWCELMVQCWTACAVRQRASQAS